MNFKNQGGQSLIEVLIGLGVGALLIGGASIAIVFVLRSGPTNQALNTATQLTQDLLNKVQSFAISNWNNFYNLAHSSSSPYFLISSSTGFVAVPGEEGVLDGDIKNGLVGRWGFDEGTGTITYDESGNGNNGTLINGPTWQSTSSCKVGYCLGFNGANQTNVQITNVSAANIDANTSLTVMAWIKAGAQPTGYWGNIIVGKDGFHWSTGYSLLIRGSLDSGNVGKLEFSILTGGVGNGVELFSQKLVNDNNWHFVVGVFSRLNGTMYVYVDGVLSNTANASAYTTSSLSNTSPVTIGEYYGARGTLDFFSGIIDDVRIYNRALSASEIQQLYNSNIFRKYFYINNVCRSILITASSSLDGTPPCGGGYFNDPSTQQVVAVTEWDNAGKTSLFSLSNYITHWANFVFDQTDWSGGVNSSGVYSSPSNQYASSSNVTTTFGSFQIQNLTQQ